MSTIKIASADEPSGTNITLSPAVIKDDVKPGEKRSDHITVYNKGAVDYDFEVSIAPYSVTNEEYDTSFTVRNERTEITDWTKFTNGTKFHLNHGEQIDIPYTIDIPKDALGGGQYATIFAQTVAAQSSGGESGVVISKRVGALLFAKVAGDLFSNIKVVDKTVEKWSLDRILKVNFRTSNDGNVDAELDADVKINSLFGKEVFRKKIEHKTVLPNTTRLFDASWENTPLVGIYKVSLDIKIDGKTQSLNQYSLICPLWLIILIIVSIILLVLIIILIKKKIKKSKIEKAKLVAQQVQMNQSIPQISEEERKELEEFKKWQEFKKSQEQ